MTHHRVMSRSIHRPSTRAGVSAAAFLAVLLVLTSGGTTRAATYPCTDAGLASAFAAGGDVDFACGGPATLTMAEGVSPTTPIDIDGGGLVTIDVAAGDYGANVVGAIAFRNLTLGGSTVGGRGVLVNAAGDLTFDRVTIRGNTFDGNSTVTRVAQHQGSCSLTVTDSTFEGDPSTPLEAAGCSVTIESSTFDGTFGVIVLTESATGTIRNCTITNGLGVFQMDAGSSLTVSRSILSTNQTVANLVSGGHNIFEGSPSVPAMQASDAVVSDLRLAPLADNGGPTKTRAIQEYSPAINFAPATGGPSTDQRGAGYPRVLQGRADAGAFESTYQAVPGITGQPQGQTLFAGQTLSLSVTAIGPVGLSYQWKRGGTNIPGATSATFTKTATTGDAGSYTVVVTGPDGSVTSNAVTVTVHGAPVITAQPQSVAVFAGQSLSLSVTASGAGLRYQWKKGGSNIAGATGATFTKGSVTAGDAGNYTVVVSNDAGSVTSSVAVVTVNGPPSITAQPQGTTVFAGQSLSLSVTASGAGLRYQWKKGGANVTGATSATFTKTATVGDAGDYTVVVSNDAGSVTSSVAAVTVNGPPSITAQPQGTTVFAGQSLSLSVTASGVGLRYQWTKGGSNIAGATGATFTKGSVTAGDAGNYTVVVSNDAGSVTSSVAAVTVNGPPSITAQPQGTTVFAGQGLSLSVTASGEGLRYQWKKGGANITGATSATFTKTATVGDAGDYTVVVSNDAGSVTSSVAVVTVNGPPSITVQPQGTTVFAGQSLSLSVTASGEGLSYQWKKGGANITGATSATFTKTATVGDAGDYTVVVSNDAGSVTSSAAAVTVNGPPSITGQPQGTTVFAGQSLSLSVTASGEGLSYQWKKGGANITGATSATFTKTATVGDAGDYAVVVSNDAGSVTSSAASVVVHGPPVITAQPQGATLFIGASLELSVTATGEQLSYQWRKGGADIAGATSASYSATVTATDGGVYDVVVSNPAGAVTSDGATIVLEGAPVITLDPADVTLFATETLTLSVEAEGAALTYQWRQDGDELDGATAATYSVTAEVGDAGSYDVVVSNASGAVTSNPATVVVHGPPEIVTPPSAATVFGSETLTLSVVASGEQLSYQWRKGGAAIDGATEATFTTTATADDAGSYDVVVSNPAGSVTAAAVDVVVYGPPTITTQPSDVEVDLNAPTTLSVVAEGEALTYQWSRAGAAVDGATQPSLTIDAVNDDTAGTYVVTVTNPAGAVTSDDAQVSYADTPPADDVEADVIGGDATESDAGADTGTVVSGSGGGGCQGGAAPGLLGLIALAALRLRRRVRGCR